MSKSGKSLLTAKRHAPCELRTKCRLGGPTGDYIGFWGGPIKKGYTTNLVQGSCVLVCVSVVKLAFILGGGGGGEGFRNWRVPL